MSLDTVLKIGNILRNSREKMSFSNAVVSCRPKDNGDWPFCLSLPVDKNFNILIGGIKIRLKISIFYGEKVVHLADF